MKSPLYIVRQPLLALTSNQFMHATMGACPQIQLARGSETMPNPNTHKVMPQFVGSISQTFY